MNELVERTMNFVRRRSRAYNTVFKNSRGGGIVLEDLAKFCRANESTFHADARMHAVLEGRREVWLRIQQHLNLTPNELFALYTGNSHQLAWKRDEDGEEA